MIFKTYENDLDGIFNKLGFNKRTFAEWGSQVKEAFNGAETGANKFYTTLNKISSVMKTAFTVPKDKLDWIKNSQDEIVTKNNIDSYIPQLSQDEADGLVKSIQAQSIAVTNGTKNWQDYFQELDDKKQGPITDLIKNTKDLSKLTGDDLVQATNAARESALKHNAALQQETLGAKAATLGLEALSVVGNALISMGISFAISAIIKGIDNLAHSAQKCKERVNDLMNTYDSALNTANDNASTAEKLADKYENLSTGVNNLGENVSLTTAEYAEYNDIVNQIADMFPTLVAGYTDEGNAILTLKGNVEGLRDAYKEAQKEAYNLLITSGEDNDGNDIIKNWKNHNEENVWSILFDVGKPDAGGSITYKDAISDLKKIINSNYDEAKKALSPRLNDGSDILSIYGREYLGSLGFSSETSEEDFYKLIPTLKATLQSLKV